VRRQNSAFVDKYQPIRILVQLPDSALPWAIDVKLQASAGYLKSWRVRFYEDGFYACQTHDAAGNLSETHEHKGDFREP